MLTCAMRIEGTYPGGPTNGDHFINATIDSFAAFCWYYAEELSDYFTEVQSKLQRRILFSANRDESCSFPTHADVRTVQ